MKILQINSVYKTGSTGKIIHDIHTMLKSMGHESLVAYGRGEHDEDYAVRIGSKADMYLHGIGSRLFDRHGLYSKKATKRFIDEIKHLDIDIFHLHNIHGYYLHYLTLFEFLKEADKPVVWTLHDCWSYTGHCAHYDYIGCDKWESRCMACPQIHRYPASLLVDNSENNFSLKKEAFVGLRDLTIVTPSNWLGTEVKRSFLREYNAEVIHNGIDLEIFRPRESDFRTEQGIEGKFMMLAVANVWEERKGLEYMIELSKKLDADETMVIVGLNDKQLKEIPDNIIGISRTANQQELAEIYSAADVFINPTLEDNFPTINLESLACGTPVVTFDSGGSPEAIDEHAGIIVPKQDLASLYESVGIIKADKSEQFSSELCRKRAEELFDKNDRFAEYIKLYEKVADKNV